jgi:DNA-binding FadR family transcriptional regulator
MSDTAADGFGGSAVDTVVERLRVRIGDGGWTAGRRLPSERNLASEFGVSRNTVREALGVLALTGMVDIRRGAGAFVNQLTPQRIFDPVALVVDISPVVSVRDLLAVRRVVEAETASLAAVRMTEAQLAELAGCLREMAGASFEGGDVTAITELDVRFHRLISEASGNHALAGLGAALNGSTFRARLWRGYAEEGIGAHARAEHDAIFAAIADGDPGRAGVCAAAHVAGVERFLRHADPADLHGESGGDGSGAPPDQATQRKRGAATGITVERMKRMITSGRWAVGTRIPPERTLAESFGVARNTIREALGVLARMRVVEIRRGSGAFVTDLAPVALGDAVTTMVEHSSTGTLLDLLALRRIVEAEAASRAAVLITEERLRDLDDRLARMSEAVAQDTDDATTAALDLEFHGAVADAAGNPALSALDGALNGTTFRVRALAGWYRSAGYPADAEREHAAIVDALRDRDPSRAGALAGAHVAVVERLLRAAAHEERAG